MGIFDALTTAVAGLQAQSFALQNISGNIANSQTIGYKETDTNFADLVSAAAAAQQTSRGVTAGSVASNTVQGTIQSTSVSTDMAINGDGWFVVAKPTRPSRQRAGVQWGQRLDARRRFPAQLKRKFGERLRLLLDGHSDRRSDRKSGRQLAAGFAVQQRLRAGTGDDGHPISGELTQYADVGKVGRDRFQGQSAGGAPAAAVITGSGATLSQSPKALK